MSTFDNVTVLKLTVNNIILTFSVNLMLLNSQITIGLLLDYLWHGIYLLYGVVIYTVFEVSKLAVHELLWWS